MTTGKRTFVYIDGFNLYYGSVKGTKLKWLNLLELSKRILPGHDIQRVKYFTAMVSGKTDPQSPVRQNTFIRALRSFENMEVHLGLFATHNVWRPLFFPDHDNPYEDYQVRANCPVFIQVRDTKEKGSDVNLAVHLLNDAWLDLYDVAVIFSNDSDLATGIKLVKEHKKKTIGIINPHRTKDMASELNKLADFRYRIRRSDLAACQLPSPIPGTNLVKPSTW